MHPEEKFEQTLAGFELVIAAAAALVRAKSSRKALLDAYDDAAEHLINGLRGDGIPEQSLQSIHKALGRLRLAFEQNPP